MSTPRKTPILGLWATGNGGNVDQTIRASAHVYQEFRASGYTGSAIVNELLTSCTFYFDSGYAVHDRLGLFCFPLTLVGGSVQNEKGHWVSAQSMDMAVFMYHSLVGVGSPQEEGMCDDEREHYPENNISENSRYVMATVDMILAEITGRREPTLQEQSIIHVSAMFWNMLGVPPQMCYSFMVGIPCLRLVLAHATHLMGILYVTADAFRDKVNALVAVPWRLWRGTLFWDHLDRAIRACDIPVKWVHLESTQTDKRAALRPAKGQISCHRMIQVSMTLDNTVGMLVTPSDKLLLAMVLLFTEEHNLAEAGVGTEENAGFPEEILEICDRYTKAAQEGIPVPWYYGTVATHV